MFSQKDLRQKIRTVNSIKKVTKAMETIASIRLQKAVRDLTYSRFYMAKLSGLISKLLKDADDDFSADTRGKAAGEKVLIAVTSDRGLAGYFNSRVLNEIDRAFAKDPTIKIIAVGRKASGYCAKKGYGALASYDIGASSAKFSLSSGIGKILAELERPGTLSSVSVLYTKFLSTSKQSVEIKNIFPVNNTDLDGDEEEKRKDDHPFEETYDFDLPVFICVPAREELIKEMVSHYMNMKLHSILLESQASEHASRMIAMQQSTSNADEMIGDLTMLFNKARQSRITSEIIEVVSGADSLS